MGQGSAWRGADHHRGRVRPPSWSPHFRLLRHLTSRPIVPPLRSDSVCPDPTTRGQTVGAGGGVIRGWGGRLSFERHERHASGRRNHRQQRPAMEVGIELRDRHRGACSPETLGCPTPRDGCARVCNGASTDIGGVPSGRESFRAFTTVQRVPRKGVSAAGLPTCASRVGVGDVTVALGPVPVASAAAERVCGLHVWCGAQHRL
mmetsp:Transcript_6888/g.15259  ORF Transcript_6888/g.15259 Transcript_6888/m.15259 type:complete len:204 (-) Transcript_6888:475-1086(-)